MSRWRPPGERTLPYITAAGFCALEQELKEIWVRRRDVVSHLAAAAAEGDRSENAEYIYRKKELRELDRRIRYLQKRIPDLKVVDEAPADPDKVFFGAVIDLEDESGETSKLRIVGSDEANAGAGLISVDSPLAKASLGKSIDDEIKVTIGDSQKSYWVVAVDYP
ncbi:MAG: transcription elongation factor GreB [Pseudomonadota bacterium]